ncbi:CapA family protein [Pseudoalteromonas mariniglutinosa]
MKVKIRVLFSALLALIIVGCKVEEPYDSGDTQAQNNEALQRDDYLKQTFNGKITIVDEQGNGVAALTVNFAGKTYQTDVNGDINYSAIIMGNHRLIIADDNYFPIAATISVINNNTAQQLTLVPKSSNAVSLLFAGDTMFARRFLDPSLATMTADIPDVEGALIRPATAAENAQALTQFVAPFFKAADFASVNLETPITSTPESVHPTKEFSFFSLPETLEGIKAIGIDYVALGNNHVYDFLEDGLDDTLIEVTSAGIAHSGAGKTIASAYQPEYMDVGTLKLGLFSATSITGKEHQVSYVSDATKGGLPI